jgi:hypothetical protein
MIEEFSHPGLPPQHRKKVGAVGGAMSTTVGPLRGTEGSNPFLSSGESAANLSFRAARLRGWGFDRCLWGTDWTRAFAVVTGKP